MVAFVVSVLISLLLIGGGLLVMKRRPAGAPVSWGEAMVGAVYVFGTIFWSFGVVTHQWIVWADADLAWGPDKFIVGPGEVLDALPVVIPYQALRDVVVVLIQVVYVVAWIKLWAMWQSRGQAAPVEAEAQSSDYGRPLVKAEA